MMTMRTLYRRCIDDVYFWYVLALVCLGLSRNYDRGEASSYLSTTVLASLEFDPECLDSTSYSRLDTKLSPIVNYMHRMRTK